MNLMNAISFNDEVALYKAVGRNLEKNYTDSGLNEDNIVRRQS